MNIEFALSSKILPCASPWWAKSGHLQTILGHLLPSPELQEAGELKEIAVSGGDKLVTHLYRGSSPVVVYLFHGLAGYSHGFYMQRTALLARSLGHTVFMTNHRGCGDGAGLALEPYHSGRAEDLSAVIQEGRRLFPNHIHLAIGFSLSGNALLLLAAKQRAHIGPDAAISVNAPINLEQASRLLKVGLNRIYDYRFIRDLKTEVDAREKVGAKIPKFQLSWNSTVHDFDDLYTAPAGGFKNREDYYQTCSANQFLKDIQIPTILLTAKDDPFVPCHDYLEAKRSPLAHLHLEETGGHMGYLTRHKTPLNSFRWLDYALWTFIKALRY